MQAANQDPTSLGTHF